MTPREYAGPVAQAHGHGNGVGPDEEAQRPEPSFETTAAHDMSEVRSAIRAAHQTRDRHILLCLRGPFVGQVFSLGSDPSTVGREQGSRVWLPDSGVSRQHARVDQAAGGYVITDLGSANGTFVNGERVVAPTLLADGDLLQLGGAVALRYQLTDADGERVLVGLYEASVRDPLTGAFNREYLHERLLAEVAFARRHGTELSVVMFDLDHFKRVNDTFGHPAGDAVLSAVSATVRAGIRLEDVLARYGGEEFLVVLRAVPLAGAAALAERLRLRVAELRIATATGPVSVTASFGCAALSCCSQANAVELVGIADRRLFAAKHLGRNRVAAQD
jgi:two-component system, cell cycle response regulator